MMPIGAAGSFSIFSFWFSSIFCYLCSLLVLSDFGGLPSFTFVSCSPLYCFCCLSLLSYWSWVTCCFIFLSILCCPSPFPCLSYCLAWYSYPCEYHRGFVEQDIGIGVVCGHPVAASCCIVPGPGCSSLCSGGHAGGMGGIVSGGN